MSARERFLLTITAACFGLMLLYAMGSSVFSLFGNLATDLTTAQDAVDQKGRTLRRMNLDKRFLREKMERSLSSDPDRAQTQYKSWLIQLARDTDLDDFVILSGSAASVGKTYFRHSFRITGKTDLKKGVEFLHAFYSAPILHRVQELNLTPGRSNEMMLTATIEAIGMVDAPATTENWPGKGPVEDVLEKSDLEAYIASIVRRNLFGLPNKKPTFSGSSIVSLTVGKNERFTVNANAVEREQKIASYELVKTDLDPAPVISRSGSVSVRSDEEKSYQLTVLVTDSGFPAKTAERTYTLRFRPEREPTVRAKPAPRFDNAQLAFFTGTVQIGEMVEAWILRREIGEVLKLHIGDEVQIGTVSGIVKEITFKTIQIDTEEGSSLVIKRGQNLSEATRLTSVGTKTTSGNDDSR
jgi:hypothetical protein